jgi:thiol-disulfide isomerase/thioredoxin
MSRVCSRSTWLRALLAASLVVAAACQAEPSGEAFTETRFRALQSEGALILVDVAASWCPTCARQAKAIAAYRAAHPAVPLHVLRVDFDDQKEWVRELKAPRQSTLILFRGSEQVWFSVAESDQRVIAAAIDEAVAAR